MSEVAAAARRVTSRDLLPAHMLYKTSYSGRTARGTAVSRPAVCLTINQDETDSTGCAVNPASHPRCGHAGVCSGGFTRASIADIAQRAEGTHGAVYWHFRDKFEVFHALLTRQRSVVPFTTAPLERTRPDGSADALDWLKGQLQARLNDGLRDPLASTLYRIVYTKRESAPETVALSELVVAKNRKAEVRIEQSLHCALGPGRIEPGTDLARAAVFSHATLLGFLCRALFSLPDAGGEDVSRSIVDSIFRCIAGA